MPFPKGKRLALSHGDIYVDAFKTVFGKAPTKRLDPLFDVLGRGECRGGLKAKAKHTPQALFPPAHVFSLILRNFEKLPKDITADTAAKKLVLGLRKPLHYNTRMLIQRFKKG